MKASLQDFPVALFFCQLYKMFLNFESVYEILRCGTFFSQKLLQGEIFLFAYLIAALTRLDRAEAMNDAHYNVTNYA